MPQPIPKKIKQNNPELDEKPFKTLLVDGSNVLELSHSGDKRLSSKGEQVGGIFQFLLQLRIILAKGNFRYVYVFWDGDRAGQFRFNELAEYKANRDKNFEEENLSDYMKEVNRRIKFMQRTLFNKDNKLDEKRKEKEIFFKQRAIIMECLEELFIRQCMDDEIEADDFIAYYVLHKKRNEKIVIMSNDRDLTQLISEDVIIYVQQLKKFITTKNHLEEMGYDYHNVVLKKMICGDNSDNIKGIKNVGEVTLFKNFKEFKERKVTLEEVIEKARKINEERIKSKKKPLVWAKNIVEKVTDSSAGTNIYEVNRKIIDLSQPLMTDEAIERIESQMYAPLDPEGRSMLNLYNIICKNDIDDLKDENKFSSFFTVFQNIIEKEKKNL